MLEKAKRVTQNGKYAYLEYARFADDLVILVDGYQPMGLAGEKAAIGGSWRSWESLMCRSTQRRPGWSI